MYDHFTKTLCKVLDPNSGYTIEADMQTKELLLRNRNDGVRVPMCVINQLPAQLGFVRGDSALMASTLAKFLSAIPQESAQEPATNVKLSHISSLKTQIAQVITNHIVSVDTPILRDTIVGMLMSMAIEFNTAPIKK